MSKVTPHIVTITCLFRTACRLAVAIGIFLTKSQKCHEPWRIFFDEILEAMDLKCGGGIEWWVGGGESPHDNCAFPEVHHHFHHHHDPLGWACWIQDSV